jgi:steroid 5-alpha reductase family enzyme
MTDTLLINMSLFGLYLFIYICFVFLIAVIRRDNSVMDIAYGPAFFFAAVGLLLDTGSIASTAYLIAGLMGIWATRLGLRIFKKNFGKPEDARYAAWRTAWQQRGTRYFLVRSFLQINLLQGVIIMVIALPFLVAASTVAEPPVWFLLTGIIVFFGGLLYETIADYQLDQFLARKHAGTETAPIMQTGLFRFSRRPNYFGECLIWLGLAIMVLPLPYGFIAVLSPLTIAYIVSQVTGPMLERIFIDKYPDAYPAYMATTSYIIPWIKRS